MVGPADYNSSPAGIAAVHLRIGYAHHSSRARLGVSTGTFWENYLPAATWRRDERECASKAESRVCPRGLPAVGRARLCVARGSTAGRQSQTQTFVARVCVGSRTVTSESGLLKGRKTGRPRKRAAGMFLLRATFLAWAGQVSWLAHAQSEDLQVPVRPRPGSCQRTSATQLARPGGLRTRQASHGAGRGPRGNLAWGQPSGPGRGQGLCCDLRVYLNQTERHHDFVCPKVGITALKSVL